MQVVASLRELADLGHTVVCVIHQPSGMVFNTFDDLLLLYSNPPGVGKNPPGVGRDPPGVGRDPPGVWRNPPGVGRNPPGVGRNPPGVGRDPVVCVIHQPSGMVFNTFDDLLLS